MRRWRRIRLGARCAFSQSMLRRARNLREGRQNLLSHHVNVLVNVNVHAPETKIPLFSGTLTSTSTFTLEVAECRRD